MKKNNFPVQKERSKSVIIAKRFELGKNIGSGSFGKLYTAKDIRTKAIYAAKIEKPRPGKRVQVIREAKILNRLRNSSRCVGIPKVKWYGKSCGCDIVMMELLGSDLSKLLRACEGKFSLKTTLMIAVQLIARLQFVHSCGFVHRDIKPHNFLVGNGNKKKLIHLVDYGLSSQFRSSKGYHIPYRDGKTLVGTARYASINNHFGIEQSRRDDLESLGYMLVYFLKGKLPWQNFSGKNKREKFQSIQKVKVSTRLESLCDGLPRAFEEFIRYSRGLAFEETPNYLYCVNLFRDVLTYKGYRLDYDFDWNRKKNETNFRFNGFNYTSTLDGNVKAGPLLSTRKPFGRWNSMNGTSDKFHEMMRKASQKNRRKSIGHVLRLKRTMVKS